MVALQKAGNGLGIQKMMRLKMKPVYYGSLLLTGQSTLMDNRKMIVVFRIGAQLFGADDDSFDKNLEDRMTLTVSPNPALQSSRVIECYWLQAKDADSAQYINLNF